MKKRNPFEFKNFTIHQDQVTLPVTTDACLFGAYCNFSEPKNILDLGTGTGLLSLMMNQKYPSASIIGIEKHAPTASQAYFNIEHNNKLDKINVVEADMFTFQYPHLFDAIISNPPFFVNQLESEEITRNTGRHFQDYNFTDFFQLIHKLLTENGFAWIMLPYTPINEIDILIKNSQLFIHQLVNISPVPTKKPHLSFIQLSKIKNQNLIELSFAIRNTKNQLSPESSMALSSFYLNQALNI